METSANQRIIIRNCVKRCPFWRTNQLFLLENGQNRRFNPCYCGIYGYSWKWLVWILNVLMRFWVGFDDFCVDVCIVVDIFNGLGHCRPHLWSFFFPHRHHKALIIWFLGADAMHVFITEYPETSTCAYERDIALKPGHSYCTMEKSQNG